MDIYYFNLSTSAAATATAGSCGYSGFDAGWLVLGLAWLVLVALANLQARATEAQQRGGGGLAFLPSLPWLF